MDALDQSVPFSKKGYYPHWQHPSCCPSVSNVPTSMKCRGAGRRTDGMIDRTTVFLDDPSYNTDYRFMHKPIANPKTFYLPVIAREYACNGCQLYRPDYGDYALTVYDYPEYSVQLQVAPGALPGY